MVKLASVFVLNIIQALGSNGAIDATPLHVDISEIFATTHELVPLGPVRITSTVSLAHVPEVRSNPTPTGSAGAGRAVDRRRIVDLARKDEPRTTDQATPSTPAVVEPPATDDSGPLAESDPAMDGPSPPIVLHHRAYAEPVASAAMRKVGTQPYTLFYQTWDRQSLETNRADPEAVIRHFRRQFPPDTTAFLQLDYEYEFLDALKSDPGSARFRDMVVHLCEVFDRVKAAFPQSKLTYYGLPHIAKYIKDNQGAQLAVWATATAEERAVEMARFEAIRPLLDRLDWFVPNLYDWSRNSTRVEKWGPESIERDLRWRTDLVRLTKEYVLESDRPDRPVIPMVCVYYVFRGSNTGADRGLLIPIEEFIQDQVEPAIAGGADGIAFWNNDENIVDTAFRVIDYASEDEIAFRRHTITDRNGGRPFDWGNSTDRQSAIDLLERQEALRILRAVRSWDTPPGDAEDGSEGVEDRGTDSRSQSKRNLIRSRAVLNVVRRAI